MDPTVERDSSADLMNRDTLHKLNSYYITIIPIDSFILQRLYLRYMSSSESDSTIESFPNLSASRNSFSGSLS